MFDNNLLKITQIKSKIGNSKKQKSNLYSLGLGKIGKSCILKASDKSKLGMIKNILHLIKIKKYIN